MYGGGCRVGCLQFPNVCTLWCSDGSNRSFFACDKLLTMSDWYIVLLLTFFSTCKHKPPEGGGWASDENSRLCTCWDHLRSRLLYHDDSWCCKMWPALKRPRSFLNFTPSSRFDFPQLNAKATEFHLVSTLTSKTQLAIVNNVKNVHSMSFQHDFWKKQQQQQQQKNTEHLCNKIQEYSTRLCLQIALKHPHNTSNGFPRKPAVHACWSIRPRKSRVPAGHV